MRLLLFLSGYGSFLKSEKQGWNDSLNPVRKASSADLQTHFPEIVFSFPSASFCKTGHFAPLCMVSEERLIFQQ